MITNKNPAIDPPTTAGVTFVEPPRKNSNSIRFSIDIQDEEQGIKLLHSKYYWTTLIKW